MKESPELHDYFVSGRRGQGFTNVKARDAMINAGDDMGQKTVGERKLMGEGQVSPQEVLKTLRAKGYSFKQTKELAEEPVKAF
jgi:hypothetical protein